ncbi:MAG: PHP domain-containing protein, partial [Allobaculum sp.]|nr:PHP domain-containing protein [Allobaculum sp.]
MKLTEEIVQKAMDKIPFKSPYTASEWLENLYLENYHCHKDFSNVVVTDCAESIENYAKRIKELGSGQCLYSGEHGSQGNQFHVYKVAEQFGLKYRHSAAAYIVKDRHEKDRSNCHIMIVAKNPEGRKDLNYILSIANEDGYYYQPRIDLELLFGVDPENFIVTSACLGAWKYEDADEFWLKIANHFKGNFFFEVQNHNTQRQKELNRHLLELSKKHNIPIICGLDSHYVLEENRIKRELMQKDKGIEFNDEESFWFMDYPDTMTVIERFEKQGVLNQEQILEAVLNTNVFVNECEEIIFNREFKIPNIYKDLDYEGRVKLFKDKINEKYKQDPYKSKEKIQGIRWEVDQFVESKTVDYPLFSEAMARVAVDKFGGVISRTARGSSSSFLTNNYMGLTTIDRFTSDVPLFPERFLTKERVLSHQLPDIDNNLSSQEPFVKAIRKLIGEHGCYPLMTRSTYKEKSAWLMYARVNGIEAEKSFAVSKALDQYNKDLRYADDEDKDQIHVEDYIPSEYAELYEESKSYQGITVSAGIHSCGHLCFDGDIRREIGLISAKSETTGKRTLVACVEGQHLDEFGYVKEDLLIVDAVSLTKEMFDSINEPVPSFEELKKMVDGDKATWDIYKNGITCCVNQMEKEATAKKAMKYAPQNIAELTAFISSIRPGFASLLNNFINRKPYSTGEEKIDQILESSSHY